MSDNAELHVTVEMSDDFEPGERTAAALSELVDALLAEHGEDDVSGFGPPPALRSFSFSVTPGTGDYDRSPSQWKVSGFDGKGNDVVTEEITF